MNLFVLEKLDLDYNCNKQVNIFETPITLGDVWDFIKRNKIVEANFVGDNKNISALASNLLRIKVQEYVIFNWEKVSHDDVVLLVHYKEGGAMRFWQLKITMFCDGVLVRECGRGKL